MKQYVISYAYIGNTQISLYENGVLTGYVILADYEVAGYVSCLQSQGYAEAFDVQKAQEEVDKAKENYESALSWLKRAKEAPLFTANKE